MLPMTNIRALQVILREVLRAVLVEMPAFFLRIAAASAAASFISMSFSSSRPGAARLPVAAATVGWTAGL
jgi:hypothetical protein